MAAVATADSNLDGDPMTYHERWQQLQQLWATEAGRDHVFFDLFLPATGLPEGTFPPPGTPIFQIILNAEYPEQAG